MNLIGVVISSYKYGNLASHCIESLLSQTRKADKIWFVDDGVGDCYILPRLYPEINYIFRDKNLGTVSNFQDMLYNKVDTEYVMFLGADNWLASNALESLENGLRHYNYPDILTYDIMVTGELKNEILTRHGSECYKLFGDICWDRNNGHHGSMLYKVAKAKEVGGYEAKSSDGKTEEDWVLYDRILKNGGRREHEVGGFLYYRRHRENFNKY